MLYTLCILIYTYHSIVTLVIFWLNDEWKEDFTAET